MDFTPSARVLADSVTSMGKRLTTMEVTGHRFILAEFNTHRAFSRNSASSRAIPYVKMRQKALESTAFPMEWRAEQKGMQGGDFLDADATRAARDEWHAAAQSAVHHADQLRELGLHKSIINRLLEPFLPHTIIVSATEWQGFWDQRLHPDAQPEIRVLAEWMKPAYDASKPAYIPEGGWHLPLVSDEDRAILQKGVVPEYEGHQPNVDVLLKCISVARCARVSYLTHDGIRDVAKDLELYDRLRNHAPAHASPFEHVATPWTCDREYRGQYKGNFDGWMQLRHIEGLG